MERNRVAAACRDGPLRYLGYANEVGEAVAAWVPFYCYVLSYVVAVAYVLWDTVDKFWKTFRVARASLEGWKLESAAWCVKLARGTQKRLGYGSCAGLVQTLDPVIAGQLDFRHA
jgi:hypothetical protein